jgi:hypothetical protein
VARSRGPAQIEETPVSDCCSPTGCSAPPTGQVALPLPGQVDRRNRAERRRDARAAKR